MSFHKPTTLPQKILKLLQLFWYFLRVKLFWKTTQKNAKHTGVLMVVSKLDRIGGLELQTLELSSALIRYGCLITILTDRIDDSPAIEFRSGFLIRRLPHSTKPFRLFLSLVFFLFQQRHSYQLLHVHGVTGFTLVSLRLLKSPGRSSLIKGATQDDFANLFQRNDLKHSLYRKWLLSAECFVAVSQEMKKELIACGIPEGRIKSIPNAVNTNKFTPASDDRKKSLRNRFSLSPDQIVFLFLGRLEARKGVDVLLQAWRKCSPGVLWITGSGPEADRLKRIGADLNLQNVVFHGESRSPLDFYQTADVFVFPSLKEGFPGVVLEAMSCGLPCIATRIGGVTDQMENRKQGLLVAPGNVDELADAIQYTALHRDERTQWGKESRETVLHLFDASRISADYRFLYSELLSAKTGDGP